MQRTYIPKQLSKDTDTTIDPTLLFQSLGAKKGVTGLEFAAARSEEVIKGFFIYFSLLPFPQHKPKRDLLGCSRAV